MSKGLGNKIRKWSVDIHRDLGFFFAGVIFIYAISGLTLNHRKTFNSFVSMTRTELQLQGEFPITNTPDEKLLKNLIAQLPSEESYKRHSVYNDTELKIFFKGGSSLEVNIEDGKANYEKVRRRPVLYYFSRLHINQSRWWQIFSDIFAISLIIITLTGMIMLKGKKGFLGRGGIEFAIGFLIPLIFMFLL